LKYLKLNKTYNKLGWRKKYMAKNDMMLKIGTWAFLIGILIALLVGVYQAYTLEQNWNEEEDLTPAEIIAGETAETEIFFESDSGGPVAWVLAIIGAIIGILAVMGKGTITAKETPGFLLAGIALLVMGAVFWNWGGGGFLTPWIGSLLSGVSFSLAIFVAPAVGILAIKAIWDMGKDV
jgi:hypothetical protein